MWGFDAYLVGFLLGEFFMCLFDFEAYLLLICGLFPVGLLIESEDASKLDGYRSLLAGTLNMFETLRFNRFERANGQFYVVFVAYFS